MKGIGPRRHDESREEYVQRARDYLSKHITPGEPSKEWAFKVLDRVKSGERLAPIAVQWAQEVIEEMESGRVVGD